MESMHMKKKARAPPENYIDDGSAATQEKKEKA